MNSQKKDANMSLYRRLASGVLSETIKSFKGCTIQSTIKYSIYYYFDEQVDKINDSEEQVDARNWLRNDSAEQVDQINDSDKYVDAISDPKKLVDAGSDPKSNPSSDTKVATHTTNGKFTQKKLISRFVTKITPVVIRTVKPLVTANAVDVQEILIPHQTVFLKAIVTDTAHSCARILRTPGKVSRTGRENSMPRDVKYNEKSRLISPSPGSKPNSVSPARFRNQ